MNAAALHARPGGFDAGFAPYGEAYANKGTDVSALSFTGQRQLVSNDLTTGLYDFAAREYAPNQGRWVSPDPAGLGAVDPARPQSWNRYAYVLNRPLALTDPLGLMCEPDNPQCSQRDPTKAGGGAAFWQRWDVFLIIDEMARLMGTSVVSASMGGQPVSETTTIFVGGLPFGPFGSPGQGVAGTGGEGFQIIPGAAHRHFAPTAGMYWKAFWQNFMSYGNLPDCSVLSLQLAGENLLGLSDSPPGADAVDVGLRGASQVQRNLAYGYAAGRALAYPMRSSAFRAMTGTAELFTNIADGSALLILDDALVQGTRQASSIALEGRCH